MMIFNPTEMDFSVPHARQIHSADIVWDNAEKQFHVQLQFTDGEYVHFRSFPDNQRTGACLAAIESLSDPWLVDGFVQEGGR